jgi:hypothetical protein
VIPDETVDLLEALLFTIRKIVEAVLKASSV